MSNKKSLARVQEIAEKRTGKQQIRALKRLIKEGRQSGDRVLVGAAYLAIADACREADDLEGVFYNALKASALLQDTAEYELLVRTYLNLGYAYYYQENFQLALRYDDRAYQLVKKHRIQGEYQISVLNNLASNYHMMGDSKTSIRLMNECLRLLNATAPDHYTDIAMYTLNLADNLREHGEPERAREVLEPIGQWICQQEYKAVTCDYYLRCAMIAWQLGEREKGTALVDLALAMSREAGYAYPLYEDFRTVLHTLVRDGDKARAKTIIDLMDEFAAGRTGTVNQLMVCRAKADYYKNIGRYKQAAEYYEQMDELYQRRNKETTTLQLSLHKAIRATDREIAKLSREMQEKEKLLTREPLTGLLNRRALLSVAAGFIEKAARKQEKVGAIFLDIDFFKECNDIYGHTKGDEIIKSVAELCRSEETEQVRFARYGGDEFFGITVGLSDSEITEIPRRICTGLRAADIPHEKNPNGKRITVSVGVVNMEITDRTDFFNRIAGFADQAVYHAKDRGKDRICLLNSGRIGVEGRYNDFMEIDY